MLVGDVLSLEQNMFPLYFFFDEAQLVFLGRENTSIIDRSVIVLFNLVM